MIGDHQTTAIFAKALRIVEMVVQYAEKPRGSQEETETVADRTLRQLVATSRITHCKTHKIKPNTGQ
ncbi:hypothetical protein D3C80_935200 [compost metagenome]